MSSHYQVVATLGPATLGSRSSTLQGSLLCELLRSGASAFRLNTSHITLEELRPLLEELQSFPETPIILDLQGSKWRLGTFAPRLLTVDEEVILFLEDGGETARSDSEPNTPGSPTPEHVCLPVPHGDFFRAASTGAGSEVRLNDGRVVLEILEATNRDMRARVRTGGEILPRKGVTLPGSTFRLEALSEKDTRIVAATRGMEQVRYAISYVRDGAEMRTFRSLVASGTPLIAKLERAEALADVDSIAAAADELWLCRGDLGAELGLPEMARRTHHFTGQVRQLPVPSLMAGQVLEHMTGSPTPTRSEICHLYDALQAGYAGFVLSDETAVGRFPVESCCQAASLRYLW